jgi:hypothetical protein
MIDTNVMPLRPRDRTNADRQRRFRNKIKAAVTPPERQSVTAAALTVTVIGTPEMCALAARLTSGTITLNDLRLADKLIMALVDRLPPNSTVELDR